MICPTCDQGESKAGTHPKLDRRKQLKANHGGSKSWNTHKTRPGRNKTRMQKVITANQKLTAHYSPFARSASLWLRREPARLARRCVKNKKRLSTLVQRRRTAVRWRQTTCLSSRTFFSCSFLSIACSRFSSSWAAFCKRICSSEKKCTSFGGVGVVGGGTHVLHTLCQ